LKRIILSLFTCLSFASYGQALSDLYQATVPVPDRTQASIEAGIEKAFAKVMVRLTGHSDVMQSPQLGPFLTDPRALMNAVGFSDLPQVNGFGANGIGLDVSFDQQIVDKLLRQAQLPILPSNRPRLLVWVITDDIQFGRRFINESLAQPLLSVDDQLGQLDELVQNDYAPHLIQALDDAMKDRGIPYLLPIFDLEDQLSLSLNQAWSLNADLMAAATRRYQADGWFALRLYTTSMGEIRGAWVYQHSGKRQLNDFRGPEMGPAIESAVEDILDGLLQAFTYVPQLGTDQLLVQIDGIASLSQYRSVLEFFSQLQLVDSVQLFAIESEQLVLAIQVEGRADRLHSDLLRSGKLQSKISQDQRSIGRMTYRWVAQ
jgi:hypothetical protein